MVNLSKRVGDLEEKVDTMRGEIQTIDRNVAEMLEQFAIMRTRWDERERDRKAKTHGGEWLTKFTQDFDVTPGVGMNQRMEGGVGVG